MTNISTKYSEEMQAWRTERRSNLTAPDGYLSLVGLTWLKQGVNRLGSAAGNDCVFPSGLPDQIATLEVDGDSFLLTVADDVTLTYEGEHVTTMQMRPDSAPAGPTMVAMGTVNWFVIQRGDAIGIRIRDTNSTTLQSFDDVERFPLDPTMRVAATFVAHDEPHTVPIPTILGTPADMLSPGIVRLSIGGETSELIALQAAQANQFFLIVADETTGKESYGGGRFLLTEPMQDDGSVVVDFNKATNPPCAFTPYATCPRPPAQNRLSVAITAGEKTFHYQ